MLCICETHFGVRSKCPDNFTLVARSKKIESLSPRGGVAVFKNNSCSLDMELWYDGFPDCVICHILNTDILLIAIYIPPSNSKYYDDRYFENLDLICTMFQSYKLVITGDLNCRIGSLSNDVDGSYSENPDTMVNTHGSRLKKWLPGKNLVVVNGYTDAEKEFDTNFTFYRSTSTRMYRSQNDLMITNSIDTISSFDILDKSIYSDHVPISTTITVRSSCSPNFVLSCAEGIFSDDHLDINKRKSPSLIFSRIDWPEVIKNWEDIATTLMESCQDPSISNDEVVAILNTSIYDTCKRHYRSQEEEDDMVPPPNANRLNSSHIKAIASMNFYTYNHHTENGADFEIRRPYLERYLLYEKLACDAEEKEINSKQNRAWKNSKGDGRKMWDKIDWKGRADTKKESLIRKADITPYFKKIFQSEKTEGHPKVESTAAALEAYHAYVAVTDDEIKLDELQFAVKKVGTGVSIDGIPSTVIQMLPPPFLDCLLVLMRRIFLGEYPRQWEKQILNALAKSGHTCNDPKLRGVGVAPVLARVYDIIINQRFIKWYAPNREQSGFRPKHGCLLPLFTIFLLIHYSRQEGRDLCIGFMDYEKAFDYANRAAIVLKLIEKGCGRIFTEAVAKMFKSTTYIPSYDNKLCEEIRTSYGVAQGRNSSPDFYSFFVSDMPRCTDSMPNKDFIDPHNIVQLADDSTMLADGVMMLGDKMCRLLDYSAEIYQVPNIPKTVYCHFSDNPSLGPLRIDENTVLASVDPIKGHRCLGLKFLPTSDADKIIMFNLEDRLHHWVRFYAWLEENEETPIEIKLLVLDCCIFLSILYGVEVFGNIECIERQLRLSEQKALRSILRVKQGTSIDLLYNELKRPDIISTILDYQYNFFKKIESFDEEAALVKSILRICSNTSFVHHYESLEPDNRKKNVSEREDKILESVAPMLQYYNSVVDTRKKSHIYCNYIDDRKRFIITRWRLSNHKLLIETGRYHAPYIEREDRKCWQCNVVEDEYHAIYSCPAFAFIRRNYEQLLTKYQTVKELLNPDVGDIYEVAELLTEIDDVLNKR